MSRPRLANAFTSAAPSSTTANTPAMDDRGPTIVLAGGERREHRRHELSTPMVMIERIGTNGVKGGFVGTIADLSAGGVRLRTSAGAAEDVAPGQTIDVRLSLPEHAGISPFIQLAGDARPTCEWVGRLEVLRRTDLPGGEVDIGGRLLGMTSVDRGMLGLYLSIQPLAA